LEEALEDKIIKTDFDINIKGSEREVNDRSLLDE
jgi:hypothetical protein